MPNYEQDLSRRIAAAISNLEEQLANPRFDFARGVFIGQNLMIAVTNYFQGRGYKCVNNILDDTYNLPNSFSIEVHYPEEVM